MIKDKLLSIAGRPSSHLRQTNDNSTAFPIQYDRSEHETKILEYFGDRLYSSDGSQQPNSVQPVFLCFTNRCGSNLLADALLRTGKLGHASEYFNWPSVIKRSGDQGIATFEDFCRDLVNRKAKNGLFASKIGAPQLLFLSRIRMIPRVFANPKFVYIRRRDLLTQAISHSIAKQTGSWTSQRPPQRAPIYDGSQIASILRRTALNNARFQEFFGFFGLPVFEVAYEELVENLPGRVSAITMWLGLGPSALGNTKERFSRQEDPIKEEWRSRFVAEGRRFFEDQIG